MCVKRVPLMKTTVKEYPKMLGEYVEISQIAETLPWDTRTVKKALHDIDYVKGFLDAPIFAQPISLIG